MTVFLTGANGFIGRHVLDILLTEGNTVICFGRREAGSRVKTGRIINLVGDLTSGASLEKAPWGEIDLVIHLAASGVKAAHRVWTDALAVNVVGTQRLLEAVARLGHRRPTVFLARTFYEHLVGESPVLLENPYISTKLAGNTLARLCFGHYTGRIVFGTFFQVYGAGDDSGNVLSYLVKELKAGRAAFLGSGRGLRDWIYVTDAAAAVVASVRPENTPSADVDIGSGQLVSLRETAERLVAGAGLDENRLVFDPTKDRPDVDLALAARRFPRNWRSEILLNDGLALLYKNS